MEVATAYRIIKQLDLSRNQERELAAMLNGTPPKRRKKTPVITVEAAKRIFIKKMSRS